MSAEFPKTLILRYVELVEIPSKTNSQKDLFRGARCVWSGRQRAEHENAFKGAYAS
jgi:hypothetical protein